MINLNNRAWFSYYGSLLGMSPRETLSMIYGELMDIIACKQIAEGRAIEKKKWTFDAVMALE